jgi:uncharacterized glyoxalase superfamily protein PhnB
MTIIPELLVDDLAAALDFYQTHLGFSIVTQFPENQPIFALIKNDQAQIMLYHRQQFTEEIPEFATQPIGGTFVLYINVADIQSVHTKMRAVSQIIQPLHKTEYGSLEFTATDPSGYKLMFSQRVQ